MRKIVAVIFLVFTVSQITQGQIIYESTSKLIEDVYWIEQTRDSCFLISGGSKYNFGGRDSLLLCKIDSKGVLLWRKAFYAHSNTRKKKNIEILKDGSILLTGTNDSVFSIRKIAQDGELLWLREYTSNEGKLIAAGAEETSNGIILASAVIPPKELAVIYELTMEGNLIQQNIINVSTSSYGSISFLEIDPNLFLLTTNEGLYGISSTGKLVWSNQSFETEIISAFPTSDGKIVAIGDLIYLLNSQGEILTESLRNKLISAGVQRDDSFYFIGAFSRLIITDKSFNLKKEIRLDYYSPVINVSIDDKLLLAGSSTNHFINFYLIKLNKNDKLLEIRSPNGGERLISESNFIFSWRSINIDSVDIDFSSDAGSTWIKLATNYSNLYNSLRYKGNLNISDSCLLKVSDSHDLNFNDISDSLFSVIYYQEYDYIAANQVKMWMGNNGMSAHNPITDDSGFYWPGGEDAKITSIFTDGILIGGKVDGEVRVLGTTYRYGLKPGSINEDGTPSVPLDPAHQLFKIKKDVSDTESDAEKLKYKLMYENWPVEKGAPWWDVNGDGKFTHNVDKPAMIGDEVLFFVANDLDSNRTKFLYGSPPVGLEFQTTVFASDDPVVEDVVFKKVKIINKSGKAFEDVYISYWTDDDLGNASDDYVGCDTTLSLGYTYNGDNDDEFYYGSPPPAVGHLLIQGPKVLAEFTDSAYYDNRWIEGYKNLPLTAFLLYIGSSSIFADPDLGVYAGSLQMYNQMHGLVWNGEPLIDPTTGRATKFCLYGDPVDDTGWYESQNGWTGIPSDRRYLMSSGPFTMAPEDTQEVVYAIYMARGTDNLNSITKLKEKAPELVDYYFNEIPKLNSENQNLFPNEFSISNNYPNPFNASTTIEFNLPLIEGLGKTSLRTVVKVYDILGREVRTLLNKELLPGPHKIEFNGNGLASGVYLLRFEAEERFQTIKKLMLLK